MPAPAQNASSLKERMHSGETLIGVSVPVGMQPERLTSVLEQGSYNFCWVDAQHTPVDEAALVAFTKMAADLGVDVMFRMMDPRHAYLVGHYLDLGVSGVEVPLVELERTVDEAVSNFYYSPVGRRSWGGAARLGFAKQPDRLEYSRWWNETGVLWVQIESINAVTHVRKLAKPGVDCISFGPADLSYDLEANPNHPFKSVDDCMRYAIEQLQGTGVAVCARGQYPSTRQKYTDMGASVLMELLPT
jgi:4-hydroxy-2-oxoheptanedioate aldolase